MDMAERVTGLLGVVATLLEAFLCESSGQKAALLFNARTTPQAIDTEAVPAALLRIIDTMGSGIAGDADDLLEDIARELEEIHFHAVPELVALEGGMGEVCLALHLGNADDALAHLRSTLGDGAVPGTNDSPSGGSASSGGGDDESGLSLRTPADLANDGFIRIAGTLSIQPGDPAAAAKILNFGSGGSGGEDDGVSPTPPRRGEPGGPGGPVIISARPGQGSRLVSGPDAPILSADAARAAALRGQQPVPIVIEKDDPPVGVDAKTARAIDLVGSFGITAENAGSIVILVVEDGGDDFELVPESLFGGSDPDVTAHEPGVSGVNLAEPADTGINLMNIAADPGSEPESGDHSDLDDR